MSRTSLSSASKPDYFCCPVHFFFLIAYYELLDHFICNLTTFCCANQIVDACNLKYIKYLSCICRDGHGIFWVSEFLLNPLSMVFISVVGPTVFCRKFCQILQASLQNSVAYRGKIVHIPRLTMVFHL